MYISVELTNKREIYFISFHRFFFKDKNMFMEKDKKIKGFTYVYVCLCNRGTYLYVGNDYVKEYIYLVVFFLFFYVFTIVKHS